MKTDAELFKPESWQKTFRILAPHCTRLGLVGGGSSCIQSFGKSGFLPAGRVLAERFFLLRFVDDSSTSADSEFFASSAFPDSKPIIKLFQASSQTAAIASICGSMLQTLSMRLEGRGMIGHPK